MQARIRTHVQDGVRLPECSFGADPEEIAAHPEDALRDAAQWCSGMARAMWLQASRDCEVMVEIAAEEIPGDLTAFLDMTGEPEDEEH